MRRSISMLALAAAASGCGGTSYCELYDLECADDADRVVLDAMTSVESAQTWALLQGNGDGLLARVDLLERNAVPGVTALLNGGDAAAALMREKLRTADGYAIDHALVVYAYALGKMGDSGSLDVLADLIEVTSHGTDLDLTPHAAADAVFQILGDPAPRADTFLDYGLPERDAAVAAARAATVKQAASQSGNSCQISYTLADASGIPITYLLNGKTVPATFECVRRFDFSVPEGYAKTAKADVLAGGGSYVPEFDNGEPSRRYNCAGFSFRELSNGDSLNCVAPKMLAVLTGAGVLTKKDASAAVVNDKVFYIPPQTSYEWLTDVVPGPPHVAVVHSVAGGNVTVRAPDNQTGVFDADINATYFIGEEGGKWTPLVYEWTNGVVPRVISTVDASADPRYCSDECGGGCSATEVCLDGSCVPKTAQTSCELRIPQCCPGQDNSCTAPDAQCFCDAYCVTANDCCPDACGVCGYCG